MKKKQCKPCEGFEKPLTDKQVFKQLEHLNDDWHYDHKFKTIYRKFEFKDHYTTIAFVNAIAWVSHTENHHPDLIVSYNSCQVCYTTHAIKGLSENDFICAKKIDTLVD